MIECRTCRGYFRSSPEKIGARCPKCRAPLFERPDRQRPEMGLGACATHPGVDAIAKCERCGKSLCAACRTRWYSEVACVACVEMSLNRAEPNPREVRKQGNRAVWSFTFALLGWIVVLLSVAIVLLGRQNASITTPLVFCIISLVPALFAVGQGCPVLRARGPYFRFAATGIVLGGLQLGLLLGVFLINLWHN